MVTIAQQYRYQKKNNTPIQINNNNSSSNKKISDNLIAIYNAASPVPGSSNQPVLTHTQFGSLISPRSTHSSSSNTRTPSYSNTLQRSSKPNTPRKMSHSSSSTPTWTTDSIIADYNTLTEGSHIAQLKKYLEPYSKEELVDLMIKLAQADDNACLAILNKIKTDKKWCKLFVHGLAFSTSKVW